MGESIRPAIACHRMGSPIAVGGRRQWTNRSLHCDSDLGELEHLDGGFPGSDHDLALKSVRVMPANIASVQQIEYELCDIHAVADPKK